VSVVEQKAVLNGTDQVVLAQRADFLRPDSRVVILMLANQNDCSIQDGGFGWIAAQLQNGNGSAFHMPKARQECATNPNDPCCLSCAQDQMGCQEDPSCATPVDPLDDNVNLRCFDQKRRFGIDFLYPIERYRAALTEGLVADRDGALVKNPLFAGGRAKEDVFLIGIVGVPWQDIARRDPAGKPNLLQGLNGGGEPVGGLQSAEELAAKGTWDIILGDPANGISPTDPLMIESIAPRMGVHPITGDPMEPPSEGPTANPINGHERQFDDKDDLQFACIFNLPEPVDCSMLPTCPCLGAPNIFDPSCQDEETGTYSTSIQYRGGAYPGIRQLMLLKELGEQGIVGSICPAQIKADTLSDFGYRPVITALAERLAARDALAQPATP
jgi:hypothetical protein